MSKHGPTMLRGAAEGLRSAVSPPGSQSLGARQVADTGEVLRLLESERFERSVGRLAGKLEMTRDQAWEETVGYLREMAATHQDPVIRRWQRVGRWLTRGYDSIVDEDSLAKLRRLNRKHSLVFLMSHRSYLDEFTLPPVLQSDSLAPLFGLAGANLDFFPFGTIARRTGIVHVRRSTGDIPLYRLALRSYVGQLVAERSNLVWSIEGGRSRTGKLRPPRLGLLRYVVDALDELPEADPLLVPVSIMYDQLPVHEVGKMASEARGENKEAEDVRWLINYASGLRERLGRVYLDFGTPLPLRERLEELRAVEVTENQVDRVALEMCHRINAATPFTPTAAVCIALLAADRALTLDEVMATVRPLADYLSGRGWPVSGGASLTDRSTLRWALRELSRSGVLTAYSGGNETVWGIGTHQHLIAAVYRNSAVHVLLVRAIAELTLQAVAESSERADSRPDEEAPRTAVDEALRLRELLKFDFFFAQREQFLDELAAEIGILARPDIASGLEVTPEQAREWLAHARPLVSHLVLRPFLDAYRVVAEQLATLDDDEEAETKSIQNICLRVGHQWALQRILASEESVSGEMFGTALKLAAHRDLLKPGAPYLGKRRREFADEMAEVASAIGRVELRDRNAASLTGMKPGFPRRPRHAAERRPGLG